jgi:hypothetical protein
MTEADIPDFVRIQRLAFRNDWSRIMNPHPPTEEETKQDIEKYAKALREESDCYFVKVIDAELDGKTIACAKWRINEKERTWEEIDSQIPPAGEGISQALSDFMAFLVGSRKKWMGTKPFYCEFMQLHQASAPGFRTTLRQLIIWNSSAYPGNRP